MVDSNFYRLSPSRKLSDLAEFLSCDIDFNADDVEISGIASLTDASSRDITFLDNKKYFDQLLSTKAAACLVSLEIFSKAVSYNLGCKLLAVKNPYFAYSKLLNLFYQPASSFGVHRESSAYIANSAKIGKNCYIGHHVVIGENAVIGDDCVIESCTVIGAGVKIGCRGKVGSNVSIQYSVIGDEVVILPGARIGQDGFGFATEGGRHYKIYHIGRVIIGNNVEIGANTTIDRGSLSDTVIEDLCRIDNLVQIGHNVKIGRGSIIVAQAGVAGSTKIGNYCALGGQAGLSGHITIGDFAQVAAGGGVIKSVEANSVVGGFPAVPIRDWHKQSIIMKNLIKKNHI